MTRVTMRYKARVSVDGLHTVNLDPGEHTVSDYAARMILEGNLGELLDESKDGIRVRNAQPNPLAQEGRTPAADQPIPVAPVFDEQGHPIEVLPLKSETVIEEPGPVVAPVFAPKAEPHRLTVENVQEAIEQPIERVVTDTRSDEEKLVAAEHANVDEHPVTLGVMPDEKEPRDDEFFSGRPTSEVDHA